MTEVNQNPQPDFSSSGPIQFNQPENAPQGGIEAVVAKHEQELLAIQGVTSVGIGFGPAGREVLALGVIDAGVAASLPPQIDGIPVRVFVTGEIEALGHC